MKAPLTVLAIGYYKVDIEYLLAIAQQMQNRQDCRFAVLVTSQELQRHEATELVSGQGFDVVQMPSSAEVSERLPFKRARLLQKANIELAKDILCTVKPDVVLTTSNLAQGYFFPTADEQGIPSLYLQWTEIHSLAQHKAWWKAEERKTDKQRPFLHRWHRRLARPIERLVGLNQKRWPMNIGTTAVAVQGPFYKQMALDARIPEEKILTTGNPQCDEIYSASQLCSEAQQSIRNQLGLNSKRFLLYMREHVARLHHVDQRQAYRAQIEAVQSMQKAAPDLAVVVKLHPKEGSEEAALLHSAIPGVVIIRDEIPTGALIAASEMVVSTTSSTLLWAVGIDRPAISAFLLPGYDELRMRRHWSGVEKVDTSDELRDAVRKNLNDPEHQMKWADRREKCREMFLVLDGQCTDRIVTILSELAVSRQVL